MIAKRIPDEGDQLDQPPAEEQVDDLSSAEPYEVRRSQPQVTDSFVGGLDILTFHRMVEDEGTENADKKTRPRT